MQGPTGGSDTSNELTLDDLGKLILEHGFLDLDFQRLAQHHDLPMSALEEAADGSLLLAVTHAMHMATDNFNWPVGYDNWQDLLYYNAMSMWDFMTTHPGYARLLAAGIGLDIPARQNKKFMQMLFPHGLNTFEVRLATISIIGMIMSHCANIEALQSRTGNIAEMYSDFLAGDEDLPTSGTSLFIKYKAAQLKYPDEMDIGISAFVKEAMQTYEEQLDAPPRDLIAQRVKTVIAGIEQNLGIWSDNGAIDASQDVNDIMQHTVLPSAAYYGGQCNMLVRPHQPATDFTPAPDMQNLDELASLILDYGFFDVDFNQLANKYRVPVSKLISVSPSLTPAVGRAMDMALEGTEWPVYYPTWRKFVQKNCLSLWHFFAKNPGYARLLSSGIMGTIPLVKTLQFVKTLGELGLCKEDVTVVLNTVIVPLLDECAGREAIYSFTGNIAELSAEFATECAGQAWDGIICFNAPEPQEEPQSEQDQIFEMLSTKVTELYFGMDADLAVECYERRLAVILSGLERNYSEQTPHFSSLA